MIGRLKIYDADTGEVLARAENQIHPENMAEAIALTLSNRSDPAGHIDRMNFGNGGSSVNGVGVISYLTKNLIGQTATLYNQTFSKIINDNNPQNNDPVRNRMEVIHVPGNLFTDLVCHCTLGFNEPAGQNAIDNTQSTEAPFVFDEIALQTLSGRMITHIIFSPVEKSANRTIRIEYTLRVSIV
jgi:hypothetical protein